MPAGSSARPSLSADDSKRPLLSIRANLRREAWRKLDIARVRRWMNTLAKNPKSKKVVASSGRSRTKRTAFTLKRR